jgi:prepilin-type N-terminal cleavage/methylation domain-containing protein
MKKSSVNHRSIKGFSLIELLVVIAIISVLATVAIPQYQIYVDRAKFINIVSELRTFRLAIVACHVDSNDLTYCVTPEQLGISSNSAPNFDPPNAYFSSISLSAPNPDQIVITAVSSSAGFTSLGATKTYILTGNIPTGSVSNIIWQVSGTCLDAKLCLAE